MNKQALTSACFISLLGAVMIGSALAQPAPVKNPYLANSGWPIFHQGAYAQASGDFEAPRPNSQLSVQFQENASGGTSPWTVLAEPYSDGSQAVIGSTRQGLVKRLVKGESFEQVSFLPLPRQRSDFDWNVLVLATGEIVSTSRRDNTFYFVDDTSSDCPSCELEVKRTIVVPKEIGQITIQFALSYDGYLIVLLEDSRLAAVSLKTGEVEAIHDLAVSDDAVSFHNAFPIDETGRLYISSQEVMTAVDWTGDSFQPAWRAAYDFRGPGCQPLRRRGERRRGRTRLREAIRVARGLRCTGSGTTPSLIGNPNSGVVVTVDGHAPRNRLVAFWRGNIPPDWEGLPNEEPRVAAIMPLPYSTPEGAGFTAENSPAVLGNSVFVAQWAGLAPSCDPVSGVQRVDWDLGDRKFDLVWANEAVHFNGIPTVSARTKLVYGSGRVGCAYHYRGLDIETGEILLDHRLGEDARYLDQGNQHTIAADGSIVFSSRHGIVRIKQAP